MNARTIILIAGVGMTLGCGRFFGSEPPPVHKNPPPPPPPTGNPPGPTDSGGPPSNPPGVLIEGEGEPDANKSAVDGALEEGGE